MSRREIQPSSGVRGSLRVPPSKSLTNRHLNLALLASKPARLRRPLLSEDTTTFLEALRVLGMAVSGSREALTLAPAHDVAGAKIWCEASGTMMRFLTAALAGRTGRWELDGIDRLRERPLGPLIEALRALGADVVCMRREGYLPLAIRGGELSGGRVRIAGGESSQYLSALMMAASRAGGEVSIECKDLISSPYVDLTLRALAEWGGRCEQLADGEYLVRPAELHGGSRLVEGDFSSACYFAAAAALVGGQLTMYHLHKNSGQGDRLFLDVLAEMGVRYVWDGDDLIIKGGQRLAAVDRDLSDLPDQVPTLACLAPFAAGTTKIRNVPHLRLKESDRLAVVAEGLRSVGAEVEELPDGLVIPGVWADSDPPVGEAVVDAVQDHRIAMSFSLLGLRRAGTSIIGADAVNKSYPAFWEDLDRCTRHGG